MKRVCSLALFLTLSLAVLLALPVCAEDIPPLEAIIIESCTYNEPVDLSAYNLTAEDLDDLYDALCNDGSIPWYACTGYTYNYYEETDKVTTFTPQVLDEAVYNRALYEQKVAEVLEATVFEGMAPEQIALSIHDYLIANSAYDSTLVYDRGYDILVRGTSVCSGYAEAYMELMNRAGVPTVMVTSEAMNHGWNLVQINGNWYHVDLTWDDPTPNRQGQVSHKHFLLTDEQIRSDDKPHFDWKTDITCTDTTFTDAFWTDIESPIFYADRNTCYLLREDDYSNYIYSRNESTGEETLLHINGKEGLDIGQGSFYYPHQGLSLWNGKLYFSGTASVFSMNTDGSDIQTVFTYDAQGNEKHILGCHVRLDTVHLTLRTHGDLCTEMTAPLESTDYHVHSYSAKATKATCVTDGQTVHTCACGLTFQSNHAKAKGHSYEADVVRTASFFSDGETVFTCSDCGDSYAEYTPQINPIGWLLESDVRIYSAMAVVFALISFLIRILTKKNKTKAS